MLGVNNNIASYGSYCGRTRTNPIAIKGSRSGIGGRGMLRVIQGARKDGDRVGGREIFLGEVLIHMSSIECESWGHTTKVTSSVLIQKAC